MPFVGCSIGDIISIFNLIITAVDALDDCCGSSAEYRKLEIDFATTRGIIQVLEKILATEKVDPEVAKPLYIITLRARGLIEEFQESVVTRYEALSTPGKKGWKYVVRALRWSLCEKQRILAFRREISSLKQDAQLLLQCHMNHTIF